MAETNDKGAANIPAEGDQPQVQARVLGQYIKDLSFENPNVRKLFGNPGDKPNLQVEVNVNVSKVADKVFESAIHFKAEAANNTGTVYDLELSYAGMFQIDSMPEQMLEPFLLVNCPALLFPYLRRLVADLTREGGFPPLTLDPIDFGALYMRKKSGGQAQAKPN